MDDFPPRGLSADGYGETSPSQVWKTAAELDHDDWTYQPGKVLLSEKNGRRIGFYDNRHIITIAGSRSGKTRTLLMPNLMTYPGSCVVIDPKGELAEMTADHRRAMGQEVYILNPFRDEATSKLPESHHHNPLAELEFSTPENFAADVAQLADALIIGNNNDKHWTDSAKNVLIGIVLYTKAFEPEMLSLKGLREILSDDESLIEAWEQLADKSALYGGRAQNIGNTFLGKVRKNSDRKYTPDGFSEELRSILSTAREQTRSLDDLAEITQRSSFDLHMIGHKKPVTIYLVLPGLRIATHSRWLRLFVYQLLAALERNRLPVNLKLGQYPLRLILEEFAALGNVQAIETAAGYMAGAGCQLWTVLQDLNQLQTHYEKSWQTFLGNAGIINAFGVVDMTTTDYLSKLLGNTTILERRHSQILHGSGSEGARGYDDMPRSSALLEPAEIAMHFARETERQLIIIPGQRPVYLQRFPHDRQPDFYIHPNS